MVFMISQPMAGLTKETILAERQRVSLMLQHQGHTVMNTYFDDYIKGCENAAPNNCPLYWLGKAFESMSYCDAVYFVKGWGSARGCRLEYQAACEYGMHIVNEETVTE